MPDLKTSLGDYFDQVVQRVTVEDIVEERVDARLTQPVRPRTTGSFPGWLYGLTAAVVILLLGFVGWLAANNGEVEERPPVGTATTPTTVNPANASQTVDGVSFSFVIPAQGWEIFDGLFMSKSTHGPQGAEAIIYWARFPEGAQASACASIERFWTEPPSATALAYAVASMVPRIGLLSGPSEVTVGGRAAQHLSLMILEDAGCDPGFFYNWRARMGGALWDRTFLGDKIDVWIVDVDGTRLFIAGMTHADAGSKVSEEIQQIIESIHFE